MMPSPRPRSTRQAQAGWQYAVGTVSRANLIVTAHRWRYELAAAGAVTATLMIPGPATGFKVIAALVALICVTACWPVGRRFLVARLWCVVTPHRVRVGCAQAWIHSRDGKIPVVLITRCKPFGERVYLWCRAGTTVFDFSSARLLLAAACWAQDVRVACHPRYTHIVALDVIRREPTDPNGHLSEVIEADADFESASSRGAL